MVRPYWPQRAAKNGAILDECTAMKPLISTVDDVPGGNRASTHLQEREIFNAAADISPRRVLVVDDEALIRWSVAESLADLGCDVAQAPDAYSALRQVTTTARPYDIVVLDLRLPDMHDLSLLGTLRQLMPAAMLILMTAFGSAEVLEDATGMGAMVLHKPFELEELRRLVTAAR